MKQITFDWAAGKVTTLRGDSDTIEYYPSLKVLIENLTEPHRIVGEATFESFEISKRREVIDLAARGGHELLVLPNRQTAKHRKSLGYEEKTDEIDVQVLRDESLTRPDRLKRPDVRAEDDPWVIGLAEANRELMILRRARTMVPNKSKLGFKSVSAKDTYADTIIALLPPFKELTDSQKVCLGSAGKYSQCLVAAAAKATKFAHNRREFQHYAGLFAHGYPSQIRSDFMHWRFRFAAKNGATLSDFQRECRWLYHQIKALDVEL